MELRHLRYFVTMAEALNFTKAATRLRVAQPAVSRQVSDLEEELGVDLLKRTSHGALLMEEGKLFFEEAQDILKRVGESQTLRHCFRHTVCAALNCRLPKTFHRTPPNDLWILVDADAHRVATLASMPLRQVGTP